MKTLLRSLIGIALFVALMTGGCFAVGVPVAEFTRDELLLTGALLVACPVTFAIGWAFGGRGADPVVRAALHGLDLALGDGVVAGELGGVSVSASEASFQSPGRPGGPSSEAQGVPGGGAVSASDEGPEDKPTARGNSPKHTPCWLVFAAAPGNTSIAIVTADDLEAEEMSEVPERDLGERLPSRYRLHAQGGVPAWLDGAWAARIQAIADLRQLRVGPNGVRLILRRPLADPLALRQALLAARALAGVIATCPRFDEGAFPPAQPVPPARPRGRSRAWPYFTGTIVGAASFVALGILLPDCEGNEDLVVELVNGCPLARDALGAPVARRLVGVQLSHKSNRDITTTVLLRGQTAEGEATVQSYARTRGTPKAERPLHEIVLETSGGERIEVMTCARQWSRGLRGPVKLAGAVSAADGRAPVAVGEGCTLEGEPAPARQLCRFVVTCGGRALYGTTAELGFTVCNEVEGRAVVALDTDRRGPRHEATLDLDPRRGTALLEDVARAWRVTIRLDGAGR